MIMLLTIICYFAVLMLFSRMTGHKTDNNKTFFNAGRRSPWYMVAFGMIGASISGVSFVSVPGMVTGIQMTYIQMCIGFVFGYFAVAFILLPVYYRLKLTTIYSYLDERLGKRSYTTGASFFILSKMTGAAVRFYVACIILQHFVLDTYGIPFWFTVIAMVYLIWLYTRHGGIKTLVWTDTFQTTCMFVALILITCKVISELDMTIPEAVDAISSSSMSRIFVFDDVMSKQYFWKQFLSGIFVVIVMTGLDQDMMQKNLTCKTLKEAQKDMCTYGFAFIPANLLFLALGVLLVMLAQKDGVALPSSSDDILPMFAATGNLGMPVLVLFTVGVMAASFSSADSALTALTTSFCVDICHKEHDVKFRKRAHAGIAIVFTLFILLFGAVNSTSVIDAIYILCSYTYGPLLGLFAYGLITHRQVNDRIVPYICVASPILIYIIDTLTTKYTGYHFGYELLLLNGMITFGLLYVFSCFNTTKNTK